MKNILNHSILAILGLALTFAACDKDEVPVIYPSLKLVNNLYTYSGTITDVSLAGYEFNNCNIEACFNCNERRFFLLKGMPDGYEDIKVTVDVVDNQSDVLYSLSINVDFKVGEITTIWVKQRDDGSTQYHGTIYLE